MKEKENVLDFFENQLKRKDLDTLSQRVIRLKELQPLFIPKVATLRVMDYSSEAKDSYINGCYRSCIICSSNAVEQSLIHMLIFNSEDWERKYWEIEIKKLTFGDILNEIKKNKIKTLTGFMKDADWLRRVRNIIVAHPTYIADYTELKGNDQIIWANKIMLKDLRKILQFFDSKKRKELEQIPLTAKSKDGKTVYSSETLKQFLRQPVKIEVANTFDWWGFQKGLLAHLAFEAYKRMSRVINGLHGHDHLENP